MTLKALIPGEILEKKILLIRGRKVMLSMHLAEMYGIETRVLNQAVKRNIRKFTKDCMFKMNKSEAEQLISQNLIPHRKYIGSSLPSAFTEKGVTILSDVLNGERAVQVQIAVLWAFVKLREMLSNHKVLARKLSELEQKIEHHEDNIKLLSDAIQQLTVSREHKPRKPQKRKVKER